MIILDTHVLLWYLLKPEKLSKKATHLLRNVEDLAVSSISFWEIFLKVKKGQIDLGMSPVDFQKSFLKTGIHIIDVSSNIWLKSVFLNWEHGDPADRVIVATAISYKLKLVSKDLEIQKYYKKTIW